MKFDISQTARPRGEAAASQSLVLADRALTAIRQQRLGAFPANYAFWYAYADGSHAMLTRAVNDLLAAQGHLAQSDLERLARTWMPDGSEELASAGDGIGLQMADVVKLLASALDVSSAYSNSLSGTLSRLDGAKHATSVAALVQMIVQATAKAEQDTRLLTGRLDAALKQICELRNGLETIRTESQRDGLTGLFNRKYFAAEIDRLVTRAKQSGGRLSLLILDIDHFKAFNDTHGHLTGDQVLKLVAQTLGRSIRGAELAVRYGGEEFVVVLPDAILQQAVVHAQIIRARVSASTLRKKSTGEMLGRVSVSIGVAELIDDDTCESLLERADECLYEAKRSGRDCVVRQPEIATLAPGSAA